MNSKLALANACRSIARTLSVIVIPISILYLLFVGLQIPSEGGNAAAFFLFMFFMLAMLAGLILAWWREVPGPSLALAAIAGFLLSTLILGSWQMMLRSSPLAGPIHLIFALLVPGYHMDESPLAQWVPLISWALMIIPIVLFFTSWLIRRKLPKRFRLPIPPNVETLKVSL